MLEKIIRYGLYLLLILLPLQVRYIIIPSDNPFAVISLYGFDVLIVLLGILWLWYWYHQPTIKLQWFSLLLGLTLMALATFSNYFADNQNLALYYWLHLLAGLGLVVMVATVRLNSTVLLSIFTLNGLIQASTAIIQFVTQQVVANKWLGVASQLPETSGVAVVVTATGRWLRAYALMPHPNVAAGIMVFGLIALTFLKKNNWLLPVIATLTFGLFLTFSRSALIVWCLMIIVLTVLKKLSISQLLTTVATLVMSLIIFWPLVSSRAVSDQYIEQLSLIERQEQLQNFAELLPRYWPQGVGLGQYTLEADQPIHNVPLMITIELGVFAAIIWYCFSFRPIWLRKKQALAHPATYLLLAALLLGLFDHYWWTLPSGLLLWLYMVGWAHYDTKLRTM
ncbi:MAG: hypothetical protein HY565_05905 [Candidatus Kerfeldbacteria bacterium]|nr:hypothetical protein [Candidatus Kerfeldbacteria bacterium]